LEHFHGFARRLQRLVSDLILLILCLNSVEPLLTKQPPYNRVMADKKLTCCFTGTRSGMTDAQKAEVERLFVELRITTLYHGASIGADEETSLIAQRLGINVRAFPGNVDADRSKLAHADAWERPASPLARSKAMVRRAHLVIAAPDGPEKPRSGTWATIRFARGEGKTVHLVEP
jgi:hypothetical protein